MAIVKQYHKDTDTTYVYESVSYWDMFMSLSVTGTRRKNSPVQSAG